MEELTEFLNSSKIIEMKFEDITKSFLFNDSFYKSLRSLSIGDNLIKFIDLKNFISL